MNRDGCRQRQGGDHRMTVLLWRGSRRYNKQLVSPVSINLAELAQRHRAVTLRKLRIRF